MQRHAAPNSQPTESSTAAQHAHTHKQSTAVAIRSRALGTVWCRHALAPPLRAPVGSTFDSIQPLIERVIIGHKSTEYAMAHALQCAGHGTGCGFKCVCKTVQQQPHASTKPQQERCTVRAVKDPSLSLPTEATQRSTTHLETHCASSTTQRPTRHGQQKPRGE